MAVAVILPKVDEAMTSGKITKWLKKEGDRVEKGEAIFEVETEKVNFEVEAEASGILSKIMAETEDDIAVGTTIAFILQPVEKPSNVPGSAVKERIQVEAPTVRTEAKAIKASPLAKRIAKENNIDLSLVAGTGPGGRISKEDVLQAIGKRYEGGHWQTRSVPFCQPEAAILAMVRIADRAVVRDGEIVIRPMMTLTLSIDHRVLDAVIAANFLQSLKNYIENPDLVSQTVC